MGKASSAKKVARAARAGGRVSARQPRGLLFPGVLTLIVVLGLTLVVYARDNRRSDDLGGVPQLGDHIHQAVGVNVCGEWLPDSPQFEGTVGIGTHGDGVLHVHPSSELGTGANATLGRYFDGGKDDGGSGLGLSSTKLDYLGKSYEEGKTKCDGVKNPQLRVAYWKNVQGADTKPDVTSGDFTDLRLTADGAGFTVFYGDPKGDIPKPPTGAQLKELGVADGGQTPDSQGESTTTSAPANDTTSSTTAGEPPDATSTTAAP